MSFTLSASRRLLYAVTTIRPMMPARSWPQPWAAKTAVMRRPRMRVEANSDEMTAESG
jgi:hypothetical protein